MTHPRWRLRPNRGFLRSFFRLQIRQCLFLKKRDSLGRMQCRTPIEHRFCQRKGLGEPRVQFEIRFPDSRARKGAPSRNHGIDERGREPACPPQDPPPASPDVPFFHFAPKITPALMAVIASKWDVFLGWFSVAPKVDVARARIQHSLFDLAAAGRMW